MAKAHPPESGPPQQFANVPPPLDLYPTSDIRFVLVELGKIGSKIDNQAEDLKKQTAKLEVIERAVDRVKTGAFVAFVILSAVVTFFWWALGDRIANAVRTGLQLPALQLETLPHYTGAPPAVAPLLQPDQAVPRK